MFITEGNDVVRMRVGDSVHRVSGRFAADEDGAQVLVADVDGIVTSTRFIEHGSDVYLFAKVILEALGDLVSRYSDQMKSIVSFNKSILRYTVAAI